MKFFWPLLFTDPADVSLFVLFAVQIVEPSEKNLLS